jgi:hypothetical protein
VRDLILMAGGACLIVAALVLLRPRKTLAGDMDAPMDVERHRAKSEAEMAAPVTEADEEAAAPLVAYVEAVGTNEFPNLAFDADPLGAPIPEGHLVAEPEFFTAVTADWLSVFSWHPASRVPLASVQVAEPEPVEIEGFTQSWTRADVERMVAKAKAGTR